MSRRRKLSPEGRRGVEEYDAKQLHQFLVADAVKHHATYLPWAMEAYTRIGERTGRGAEDAYTAVLDEVETLTGLRMLPVASGVTDAEMGRLMGPPK